ncbi:MAG: hypothetical protein SFZ24_09610 [Planctomycetota bacterium]|nr:hypothetical protein [Planctomycetota bacterium]
MTVHPPVRTRRGFTLMEAVACMAVLSAMGSVVSTLLYRASETFRVTSTAAQLHAQAAAALDPVERLLRSMPARPDGQAPHLTSITAQRIAWTDADGGALVWRSGSQLMLGFGGQASTPILSDVTAFTVQPFDEDNQPIATPVSALNLPLVRRVRLSVTVSRQGVSETLSTKVFLRAMGREVGP